VGAAGDLVELGLAGHDHRRGALRVEGARVEGRVDADRGRRGRPLGDRLVDRGGRRGGGRRGLARRLLRRSGLPLAVTGLRGRVPCDLRSLVGGAAHLRERRRRLVRRGLLDVVDLGFDPALLVDG